MVIQVIREEYNCGSNIGLFYHDSKNFLQDLNKVIEWNKSTFPYDLKEGGNPMVKEDYIENREYLGKDPKLSPGNVFYWDSNIFAIDSPDRLIVLESESGFKSVSRFIDDILGSELILIQSSESINDVQVSVPESIPETYTKTFTPTYDILKLWKDKYLLGRFEEGADIFELTGSNDFLLISPKFYIKGWKVYYSDQEIDEDMAPDCFIQYISWLYINNERLILPEPKKIKTT